MRVDLTILYRGTLSSCNYECPYCPFAKHWESPEELAEDQLGLQRFMVWVESRNDDQISVFFTPWGEALVRQWYRTAITTLSQLPHVPKVAVQTNLSCNLDWLSDVYADKLGLWCTYHPGQTTRDFFLKQCQRLDEFGVSYSVGCVGLKEHMEEIEQLRRSLPDSTYLWINAYKSDPDYYDQHLLESLEAVDPLFAINNQRHPSRGRECRTGRNVVTVDSAGDVRRCHFVKQVLGNLYDDSFLDELKPRSCPNDTCGCYIGYVHLEHLNLDELYGDGIIERVPQANHLR